MLSVVLQRLGEVPSQHAKDIVLLLALYREITVPKGIWAQNVQFQPGVSCGVDFYTTPDK